MKKLILALMLVLATSSANAQITVSNEFATGQVITAAAMNENFQTDLGDKSLNRTGGTVTGNITVNNNITIDGADIGDYLNTNVYAQDSGAAGDPSFSWVGDTDNGMFLGGTNIVDFATAGTARMRIAADGTVAINSTDASALDIAGGLNIGSGNVALVDATGQITSLDTEYLVDLSAEDLTTLNASALTGNLVVSGAGPHAIGASVNDYTRLQLNGAFTSGGASTAMFGISVSGALTGHSADSDALVGTKLTNSIVTAGSSTTVAQLWVAEPTITVGSGTVTNSATVYIESAASEATNDYALWVDAGATQLDGTLTVGSTAADAIDVGGGINAGTGNVALVGTDGKINGPLSSTIIDNLSGANLTALDPDAVTNSAVTFDSGSVTLADNGVGTITGNVGNYILFVLTGETDERNMNIAFVDTANEDIILHHTSEDGSQRWSTSAGGADMWNLYFSSNSLILQNTRDDCGGGCTVDWFLIKAT